MYWWIVKGKGKRVSYLTSVAKQAKIAFLHGPTVVARVFVSEFAMFSQK